MAIFRCSVCGISWPHDTRFKKCPKCREPADPISNSDPDGSLEDMLSMKYHFMFERYYENRHTPNLTPTADEMERFTLANWKAEQARPLHAVE